MTKVFAALFVLSGISGLIYESVWTHYVKLILGHAAYAQTLVLAIFMGGMAGGSWIASRFSMRIPNLLLAYAVVELLIGVLAIVFQPIFESTNHFLYDMLLPVLAPGWPVVTAKLVVATALILPQSLLLGATFPLMSGGVLRRKRSGSGETVSLLYFANSIGAVIGVLWSGFWLVGAVGLPGALLTAGVINVALAIVVYGLSKTEEARPDAPSARAPNSHLTERRSVSWLLWAAAITGAASFCYEIAWIRMLSMVLGASTQSFELMLAAFILGLALGSLWIRRRIDAINCPKTFLGIVQLAMGGFALATMPLYGYTFEIMAWVMQGLGRNENGYALFSATGHVIAMLVMLPATVCAGMTLPLLTLILLRTDHGERALGKVYAANTLGAIVGVVASVHLLLPSVGLKGLLLFGSLLDGALGIFLLAGAVSSVGLVARKIAVVGFSFGWTLCLAFVEFDPKKMSSGVYRYAKGVVDKGVEIVSWKDGKTASIGVMRYSGGAVSITTNGKPDAVINMSGQGAASPDEMTMVLAATIPAIYKSDIRTAANIGFGSGMTTHTLLGINGVARVDSIEIESEIIQGARIGFAQRLQRAFDDKRSVVHIDDARSYFSTRQELYDLIVSEPSNPWVSGVSSLFSKEFYRHATRYMTRDGIFVQWLQVYETGMPVVASVVGALDAVFPDYRIYATNNGDALIVATMSSNLFEQTNSGVFETETSAADLRNIGIGGMDDISIRLVGSKKLWSPLMQSVGSPANSDYFPFIDQNAVRYRFSPQENVPELLKVGENVVPFLEAVSLRSAPPPERGRGRDANFSASKKANSARNIFNYLQHNKHQVLEPETLASLSLLSARGNCKSLLPGQLLALNDVATKVIPYLSPVELDELWRKIDLEFHCHEGEKSETGRWLALFKALGARDWSLVSKYSADLLTNDDLLGLKPSLLDTLFVANLSANLALENRSEFERTVRSQLQKVVVGNQRLPGGIVMQLIQSQARLRGWANLSVRLQ